MMKYILHSNGSAKNHGCEAIIRATASILGLNPSNSDYLTYCLNEDKYYGLDEIINLVECKRNIPKSGSIDYYFSQIIKRFISDDYYSKRLVGNIENKISDHNLAIALGGDNYCYQDSYKYLSFINKTFKKKKIKSILWGASIEPQILMHSEVKEDLENYDQIIARESLTFNALIQAGFKHKTNIFPDPAFALESINLPLPEGFIESKTVGINLSPLVQTFDKGDDIAYRNFVQLIDFLLKTTDLQIALIPHVVWSYSNDMNPLKKLFEKFCDSARVLLIEDHNCMELKGFISRCRMFIGARTHATIAAYSSRVPTIVVGYSIKAKGIAKDILGTYENYVIPVQTLTNESDLTTAFIWMQKHEEEIRNHLTDFMPDYIQKAWEAGVVLSELNYGENESKVR